jgi:hypothetical protein
VTTVKNGAATRLPLPIRWLHVRSRPDNPELVEKMLMIRDRSQPEPRYWFPAKRYGWGWGLPNCWQGWLVIVIYLLGIAAAGIFLAATNQMVAFLLAVGLLTAGLIVVCYLKGEPTRWRWGDE